jgi:hypothetical protein
MYESQPSSKKLLTQLESENQTHSERANAANKLCEGWLKANKLLASKDLPSLTLKDYQESIDYEADDALVFLAGADEVWLRDYQERTKQREKASAAYHSSQSKSAWSRIGEIVRIVAIGIFIALFGGFIFLMLY